MAFQDLLTRAKDLQQRISQFAMNNLPVATGVGAGMIGLPFGLGPVGGFAGYGAGYALKDALTGGQGIAPQQALGRATTGASATGLGMVAPQAMVNQQQKPVISITDSRPAHQSALEAAMARKDYQAIQQILDSIPPDDPYKQSMESLFRPMVQPNLTQQPTMQSPNPPTDLHQTFKEMANKFNNYYLNRFR